MFDSFSSDGFELASFEELADRGALARHDAPALDAPRVVTTGRKDADHTVCQHSIDPETGERVELFATRWGFEVKRYPTADSSAAPGAAIIDALAFSVVPPDNWSYVWVVEQMRRFIDIEKFEHRRGLFGFQQSARFGDGAGVMAWGGDSQRGRVYFSIMGKGCSMVKDWAALQAWLEVHRATIKRADVALDDFEGERFNIAWAVAQYQGDGFNAGGRKPGHECIGDWLHGEASTKGRTLGIGNRESGKYGRIYEKGKQLGDPASPWTRVEVELRAQDRVIPYDILTRPGEYLAGAYPCLAGVCEVQSRIKTIAQGAQIVFDAAVENAKQHCGKLVNLLLNVVGGDYAEVVDRLIRPGFPKRIEPYSYQVSNDPMMLDRTMRGASA